MEINVKDISENAICNANTRIAQNKKSEKQNNDKLAAESRKILSEYIRARKDFFESKDLQEAFAGLRVMEVLENLFGEETMTTMVRTSYSQFLKGETIPVEELLRIDIQQSKSTKRNKY